MSDEEGVKVAVRVRPFASYERDKGAKCVVRMDGAQTIVTDPTTGKQKSFTFDFSYNSFVGPDDPGHASNDLVYQQLGVGVLENAWKGFNCCLFAYGQTGSGKSYSMMGYGEDYGIIPRALREIFVRIERAHASEGGSIGGGNDGKPASPSSSSTYHVECSMLEIYNETVRDLFSGVPASKAPKGGLKVRDNPKTGPFVQGLTKNAVACYRDVEKLMDLGAAARTVAATNMNATSSRAHTVFTVVLTQTQTSTDTGKAMKKTSKINLIDLAGSERANATGATGDRLKEGCKINSSLSALGNVITALAKQSQSGGKRKRKKGGNRGAGQIPYRTSKLTHLLKQSLGGNSKTVMIAAVSPADVNFKETVTTLQYADRAKQIKNKAIVNEDPTEKMIRGLKEELERLKNALKVSQQAAAAPVVVPVSPKSQGRTRAEEDAERARLKAEFEAERKKEMEELKEQMQENERQMREQAKSWEERLRETQAAAEAQVKQLAKQGLTNFSLHGATAAPCRTCST